MFCHPKEILCTLGPASLNDYTLSRLEELHVSLLRINLSHTRIEDLKDIIRYIQQRTIVPICLDTEGAQIRTGVIEEGRINLKDNEILHLEYGQGLDTHCCRLTFHPEDAASLFQEGDFISIDFNSVLAQVQERTATSVTLKILTGGEVGSNKAVTVLNREIHLPVLTPKDLDALSIGCKMGVKHVALSFANQGTDIQEVRFRMPQGTMVISKIESVRGLLNLDEIAKNSDALLIDRGDLSRQVAIERIPRLQKHIISRARNAGRKVYVATNLLESMVKAPAPTRAEVNDIFNTLADGADGLVLAAETAIGAFPVHCVMMVSKLMQQFEEDLHGESVEKMLSQPESLLLIEPHGGVLVNRFCNDIEPERTKDCMRLHVDQTFLMSAEQIALGTFSPLTGFMTRDELMSVLKDCKLPSGIPWPVPIVLQISHAEAKNIRFGQEVLLVLKGTDDAYARMKVDDIYSVDLDNMAHEVFKTKDYNHPGVRMLHMRGDCFLGGPIEVFRRLPSPYKHYELTPRQARTIFEHKGWSKIAGFHTRNVIHRAHEHIQMMALGHYHCDGLFVHPVVGPKKKGDYDAGIIMKSYEIMLAHYYPPGKVVLGAFQNYSRYAGPREAVFTALCRKNFGCSHFIVGRDHTGVGNYYQPGEVETLFGQIGDLGIAPLFFNAQHYCELCEKYVEQCEHGDSHILSISGTEGRRMLIHGDKPPEWFMRESISEMIIGELASGREVFL